MREQETKREKFVRLAEARTNRIIETLQLLGNLSNTGTYEYTKKDIDQMFKAIEEAVSDTKNKYEKADVKGKKRFTFKDWGEKKCLAGTISMAGSLEAVS